VFLVARVLCYCRWRKEGRL